MRPLYEIDADIMGCVDTETGEIVDIERLKALEMERDAKIEGVIFMEKRPSCRDGSRKERGQEADGTGTSCRE